MYRIKSYDPEYIFGLQAHNKRNNLEGYNVIISSSRLNLFRTNQVCVCCGLKGNRFILEFQCKPGTKSKEVPHLNLYAGWNPKDNFNSSLTLMTKDHIIATANGGKNDPNNYQTMCNICNSNVKLHHNVSMPILRIARKIFDAYGGRNLNLFWKEYYADKVQENYTQTRS